MKLANLEKLVLERMLDDNEVMQGNPELPIEAINVIDREYSGVGFLTQLEKSSVLKFFSDGVSLRWGKVGARLNKAKIETGYLVYVDDGYVTTIEGYTYGDEWPAQVDEIELYTLIPGSELKNPPG